MGDAIATAIKAAKRKFSNLAEEYGLPQLHPAIIEIHGLLERVAFLEEQLGRPYVIERGPWSVSERGRLIQSDDFTHDACLTISGDFANDQQRKHYAEEIVRRLNRKDV